MKKLAAAMLSLCLALACISALGEVKRDPHLDAAFSMIEEGNPFLERYNRITGANIEARFKYGVPYYFGGKLEERLLKVWKCLETTRYYRKGASYLYGFDCSGFTRWINTQVGKPEHGSLSDMILHYYDYAKNHLPIKDVPNNELKDHLQVGDFLVGKQRARHIMMYIGTLTDYGYTAEDAPELADYLDYPLVIHCQHDPFHGEIYQKYIDENGLKCITTDGGVNVSVVGVHAEDAPYTAKPQEYECPYFLLGDYMLGIYDQSVCTSYQWFRM